MNRFSRLIIVAAALVAVMTASSAFALTFDQADVETWVGSADAANKAALVIDFGDKSFAFGYRWDGTATGFDMVTAIAANTTLDFVDDTQYGGHLINSFSYGGYSQSYDSGNWYPNQVTWSYFTSKNGWTWSESWVGSAQRVLANGDWDGWSWCASYPSTSVPPATPVTPEPTTLCALTAGLGVIVIKRKRS